MNNQEIVQLLDQDFLMLINGELCKASDGKVMHSINPATATSIVDFPDASSQDIDRAVQAATVAQTCWSGLTMGQRQDKLTMVAEILRQHADQLGALDSLENGAVFSHMKHDAQGGAFMIDYFCGIANELKGEATQLDNNLHYTRREPFGVVARLLPFNHPIQSLAAGIAAPLLTGNTLIVKPSPHTCLSALLFAKKVRDILPAGVLNIICGSNQRVSRGLMFHPDIPRLAVTGSTEVGRMALHAGADCIKTVTLELGGKTPMIVFDDADINLSVETAWRGMNLKWQGHSCSSISRVLVHASVYEEFVEKLCNAFEQTKVGNPFDEDTEMGPVSHQHLLEKIQGYLASGVEQGARLACGGNRIDTQSDEAGLVNLNGYYLRPAVFADVTPDMKIAQEEIYGPVISIIKWHHEKEAIEISNNVEYGLAAVIMTTNLDRAHSVSRALNCGYIEINGPVSFALGSPFGGFKYSGIGREGNMDELVSYTQLKSININLQNR